MGVGGGVIKERVGREWGRGFLGSVEEESERG